MEHPTVDLGGGEQMTIYDDEDVQAAFEQMAGVEIGAQVGEYTVDAIDAEFDYIRSDAYEGDELRVYLYLDPVTPSGQSAGVENTELHVQGWVRDSFITGDDGLFGIVYKLRP